MKIKEGLKQKKESWSVKNVNQKNSCKIKKKHCAKQSSGLISSHKENPILSSWRQLTTNVSHDAVNPKVTVLHCGVHQVNSQSPLPQVTLNFRHFLDAVHMGYQRSLLHVVSKKHASLFRPLVLCHTCRTETEISKIRLVMQYNCGQAYGTPWKELITHNTNQPVPLKENNSPASCAVIAWKGSCLNSSIRGLMRDLGMSSCLPWSSS